MQSTTKFDKDPDTVAAALSEATAALGSRIDAELLVGHALGRDRAWLYAHGSDALAIDQWLVCRELVMQRLQGHPVAYLLGTREFYGRRFEVGEPVLIPRPETELLIDTALELAVPDSARVVDVGTGSGCIALTLALERPGWRVAGTDVSSEALVLAQRNRDRLEASVEFLPGDLLDPVKTGNLDLVISNPPYIAAGDPHLERGDLRFEPRQALAAGPDGLEIIRRLVPASFSRLRAGGWLLIEHGHDQAAAVRGLLEAAGFADVSSRRDLAGIERVTLGSKPGPSP